MRAVIVLVLGVAMAVLATPAAQAVDRSPQPPAQGLLAHQAQPVTLGLTSSPTRADDPAPVTLQARDATGAPLAGATVAIERRTGGAWAPLLTVTTDGNGVTSFPVTVSRTPGDNVLRATYAGDATRPPTVSPEHQLTLVKRHSRVRLKGPRKVVDERSITLRVEWTTAAGEPVAGRVVLQRKLVKRPGERMTKKKRKKRNRARWRREAVVHTRGDGVATVTIGPRATFRWRAVAKPQSWVRGDRTPVRRIRNLPPGKPVRLPRNAPRPRIKLPPQRRAVGAGANPVVRAIPNRVWNHMTGRSWHRGCPVGRAGLRLVQVNYWDYDGYRRRGEMVVNAAVTRNFTGAFTELYERRLPVRAMYRVDRFGWSGRLRGANDYASMAAGNTSVFNCRSVVNNPGVRSPHSWGRSLDLNTWENPYRSRTGIVPNPWWQSRSHPRYAWRSSGHQVVALMRRHGFRWTYGLGDTHHFDAMAGASPRLAALLRGDRCGGVCK